MVLTSTSKISWLESLHPRYIFDLSTLILIVANLLPLLGFLFWHWDLFVLITLYWLETGIIGFWHILRMAIEAKWLSLFLVPFFCVHFGGFMTGHFIFLQAFFGKEWSGKIHGIGDFFTQMVFGTDLWIPFAVLFISHGVSFYLNLFKPSAFQPMAAPPAKDGNQSQGIKILSVNPQDLNEIMKAPYRRIIVMHLTIIFGGFLSTILKSPSVAFLLLVILKTSADMASHVRKNLKPVPAS